MARISTRGGTLPVALFGLVLLAGAPARADLSKAEFARASSSPDSHIRYGEFLKLNPDDKSHLKLALRLAGGQGGKYANWYDREAGIAVLGRAKDEKSRKTLLRDIKRSRNYLVRQALCVAFAKLQTDEARNALFGALDDKDPRVRREAAWALRSHRKKDSVSKLIARWLEEKDPLVQTTIRTSLEKITDRFWGPDPQEWADWWKVKQDDFKIGSKDEEAAKKAEKSGKKMKDSTTKVRGIDIDISERGSGKPLLVIPPYGYSKAIITPFLTVLEKTNKILYIDLPSIDKFPNAPAVGGLKYYPIDQLVEAFEEIRKQRKVKRFGVMAWGFNSWMALRYATKYPRSVSHVVLVCPVSGDQEFGRASQRMISQGKKTGDIELWHLGLSRSFNPQTGKSTHQEYHEEKKLPVPEGEDASIDRRSWSLMWANPHDSLLAHLFPVKDKILGGVAIPEFSVLKEKRLRCPMLLIVGAHSTYTSLPDCKTTAKHYGARLLVYPQSANMPHAEESVRFNKDLRKFLSRGR